MYSAFQAAETVHVRVMCGSPCHLRPLDRLNHHPSVRTMDHHWCYRIRSQPTRCSVSACSPSLLTSVSAVSRNNLRRGERAVLFCFQPRRDPVRFGAASSGKAAGVAPPAAFSRYKDLHRSLFSHPSFRLSSTSAVRPLAPARITRVYSPHYLLPSWLLPTIPDRRALTLHQAFCDHLRHFSPSPSSPPDLPAFVYGWSQRYRRALSFAASSLVARAAAQLGDDSCFRQCWSASSPDSAALDLSAPTFLC